MNTFTTALYEVARSLSREITPDLPERAGAALDAALDGTDIRNAAIQYVVEMARDIARGHVALVERDATRAQLAVEMPGAPEHLLERWQYHWGDMSEAQRAAAVEQAQRWQDRTASDAEETAGHIGPKKPGSTSQHNPCEQCRRCREAWAWYADLERQYDARRRKLYEQYEADLRAELFVEWTAELLASEIAMPDGARTTWGQATVEQHRTRRDMLARNATVNAENAARHSLAIEALTTSGVATLADLVAARDDTERRAE